MVSTIRRRDLISMITIAVALLCIGVAHHLVPHDSLLWHNFFQWLYYVPVVVAALRFGLWGGLMAGGLASLGYIPHLLASPHGYPDDYVVVQYAAIAIMLAVSALTGFLADQEHERRQALERTTAQLQRTHEELQTSFEQLKRADRLSAVGELAAGLAHEIRNPLGSIRGAIEVMDRPQTSPEIRTEFAAIIKQESQRLEQLLTNLLGFARPKKPAYRMVEIEEQIESIVKLVAKKADHGGIAIRRDVDPDLPLLECDPDQLRQVILNLVLNAVQAMPNGGKITISARPRGDCLVMQVIDAGLGIEEDVERVFDPFFTTKENGTGLGLAVTRRIVEQHHGTIQAERNEKQGMTFSLVLPLSGKHESGRASRQQAGRRVG